MQSHGKVAIFTLAHAAGPLGIECFDLQSLKMFSL